MRATGHNKLHHSQLLWSPQTLLLLSRPQILTHRLLSPVVLDLKEPVNETAEGPTLWTGPSLSGQRDLEAKLKDSRRKEGTDGDSDAGSVLKINLTAVNSTFNYTAAQEVRMFYNKAPIKHKLMKMYNCDCTALTHYYS